MKFKNRLARLANRHFLNHLFLSRKVFVLLA